MTSSSFEISANLPEYPRDAYVVGKDGDRREDTLLDILQVPLLRGGSKRTLVEFANTT